MGDEGREEARIRLCQPHCHSPPPWPSALQTYLPSAGGAAPAPHRQWRVCCRRGLSLIAAINRVNNNIGRARALTPATHSGGRGCSYEAAVAEQSEPRYSLCATAGYSIASRAVASEVVHLAYRQCMEHSHGKWGELWRQRGSGLSQVVRTHGDHLWQAQRRGGRARGTAARLKLETASQTRSPLPKTRSHPRPFQHVFFATRVDESHGRTARTHRSKRQQGTEGCA